MRTKYLVILPVLWVLFLFSCGNEKQEPSSTDEVEQKGNSKYGDVDFILPELDLISRSHVANWAVYEDFDNEVRLINGRSKDVLKNKTRRLVTHIDSLSKKIPDTLFSQSILSRLLIVKTRVYLLDQELNKTRSDSAQLQFNITELNKSYANLILQINEKFEKEAIDLQRIDYEKKELEKQKRFLDSVYQAELQDQSN